MKRISHWTNTLDGFLLQFFYTFLIDFSNWEFWILSSTTNKKWLKWKGRDKKTAAAAAFTYAQSKTKQLCIKFDQRKTCARFIVYNVIWFRFKFICNICLYKRSVCVRVFLNFSWICHGVNFLTPAFIFFLFLSGFWPIFIPFSIRSVFSFDNIHSGASNADLVLQWNCNFQF